MNLQVRQRFPSLFQKFELLLNIISLLHLVFVQWVCMRADLSIDAVWLLMLINLMVLCLAKWKPDLRLNSLILRFSTFCTLILQFLILQTLIGLELY